MATDSTMPSRAVDARTDTSDMLAIGFGTTVAMWAVGYVGHMPLVDAPPIMFASLMLVCLVIGGWVAGRLTARGPRGGACVGLISATLNLLILGSMLSRPDDGQLVPGAWLWIPGWFVLSAVLGTVGALVGRIGRPRVGREPINWLAVLACCTCAAAMLLIAAGGLVTGFRAGMAVPDWPNTFGANMFLYPLTRMTGGIFYEHAHRLFGTLVGSATLALAIYLVVARREHGRPIGGGLVALAWLTGAAVALQGVFGGLRVTDDSHCLAVVHGCFAHAVLGALVAIAVLLAREPRGPLRADSPETSSTNRLLTALMVGVVLLQTLLGTLVRQLDLSLLTHIAMAAVVALVSLGAGIRMWGLHAEVPLVRRLGAALVLLVMLQVGLGIVAVIFRTPPVGQSPTDEMLAAAGGRLPVAPVPALLTTAHQATAAVILGVAMALAVWMWRLSGPARWPIEAAGSCVAPPGVVAVSNSCKPISGERA